MDERIKELEQRVSNLEKQATAATTAYSTINLRDISHLFAKIERLEKENRELLNNKTVKDIELDGILDSMTKAVERVKSPKA